VKCYSITNLQCSLNNLLQVCSSPATPLYCRLDQWEPYYCVPISQTLPHLTRPLRIPTQEIHCTLVECSRANLKKQHVTFTINTTFHLLCGTGHEGSPLVCLESCGSPAVVERTAEWGKHQSSGLSSASLYPHMPAAPAGTVALKMPTTAWTQTLSLPHWEMIDC